MKTIASLEGKEFLRRCNEIRKRAEVLLRETGAADIRINAPKFEDGDTDEIKQAKIVDQGLRNIKEIVVAMLDEHFDETWDLIELLIVNDEGAQPTGGELVDLLVEIIGSPKVRYFLAFWASTVRMNTLS